MRGLSMPKSYLTVRDAAKQLELTEYRVRQLINLKEIKASPNITMSIAKEEQKANLIEGRVKNTNDVLS